MPATAAKSKKCQNVLPVRHSCPVAIVDGFELESCNPHLAHRALQAEPELGLLLPCNVIVDIDADGTNRVSIADPKQMLGVVQNEELTAIANEAEARLRRVVDKLSG